MFFTISILFIYMKRRLRKYYSKMRIINELKGPFQSLVLRRAGINNIVSQELVELGSGDVKYTQSLVSEHNGFELLKVVPKIPFNFQGWTSFMDTQCRTPAFKLDSDVVCAVLEANVPTDEKEFLEKSFYSNGRKKVHVMKHSTPLAWRSGVPYGIALECSRSQFVDIGIAFMDQDLVMDEVLEVNRIFTICPSGQPGGLLRTESQNVMKVFSTPSVSRQGSGCSLNDSDSLTEEPVSHSRIQFSKSVLGPTEEHPDCATSSVPYERPTVENMKPPNIVIYCGKKDATRVYESVKAEVKECINPDTYTIYQLRYSDVLSTKWMENTVLLIIAEEHIYDDLNKPFMEYFTRGGKVINLGSSISNSFLEREKCQEHSLGLMKIHYSKKDIQSHVISAQTRFVENSFKTDDSYEVLAYDANSHGPVIYEVKSKTSEGIFILSQVYLEKQPSELPVSAEIVKVLKDSTPTRLVILRDIFSRLGLNSTNTEIPRITPCCLLSRESEKERFMSSINPRLKDNRLTSRKSTLEFFNDQNRACSASTKVVPVLLNPEKINFDIQEYNNHLNTKSLGNVIIYSDVVESTMDLFEGFMFAVPDDIGVVAIASRQLSGKGRSGNAWLSPEGCAMFSVHVRVQLNSMLGQALSFLQHIMSLAIVHAVKSIKEYEFLDIRLKWPNDIYYGKKVKLGGVVVDSSLMQNTFQTVIGCGVNVANKLPTLCINDLIQQHDNDLKLLTTEQFIALSLTHLERLIDGFQKNGREWFLKQYYDAWLHSDEKVRLGTDDGPEVKIIGLDDYGYLKVQFEDGRLHSVHPNDNRFDMLHGLMVPKSD